MRQRREDQQITLSIIAEQTKIKASLLEAMERDDISHWPSGIFRRAFIRAYAHAINLDPDIIVREFVEAYPDRLDAGTTAEAIAAALDAGRGNSGSQTRLRSLFGSAVGSFSRRRRNPSGDGLITPAFASVYPREPYEPTVPAAAQVSSDAASVPPRHTPLESESQRHSASEVDFSSVAELCTEFAQ